jgi:hypothetical protein
MCRLIPVAIRSAAKRPSISLHEASNQLPIGVHGAPLLIEKAKKCRNKKKVIPKAALRWYYPGRAEKCFRMITGILYQRGLRDPHMRQIHHGKTRFMRKQDHITLTKVNVLNMS